MFLFFPSVLFAAHAQAYAGPNMAIDPETVTAVEPHTTDHRRSIIHTRSMSKLDIFMSADRVNAAIDVARRKLERQRADADDTPELLRITRRALELACTRLESLLEDEQRDTLMAGFMDVALHAEAIGQLDGSLAR